MESRRFSGKILGFFDFEPKLFESVMDLHELEFVVVLEQGKRKAYDFHLVLFGGLIWLFRNLWFDYVLHWFSLKSGNKPVISFSSSQPVQNLWILHLLLLNLNDFVIAPDSLLLAMDLALELQESQLDDEDSVESLRAAQKLHWFWFNLASETVRVCEKFLQFSEFVRVLSNWIERENLWVVCDVAWFCGFFWLVQ